MKSQAEFDSLLKIAAKEVVSLRREMEDQAGYLMAATTQAVVGVMLKRIKKLVPAPVFSVIEEDFGTLSDYRVSKELRAKRAYWIRRRKDENKRMEGFKAKHEPNSLTP